MNEQRLSRRDFISRAALAGLAGSALTVPMRTALSAEPEGPRVVMLFQRGGADGLNAIVPYGDPDYYALRGTLAIASPGAGADTALDLDGFFGLHPALAPLRPAFEAGELALLPAVGHDGATRSHFDAQDHLEVASANKDLAGWLNRYLQRHGTARPLRAVSFGSQHARMLRGAAPASVFNDLTDFTLAENPEGAALLDTLAPVFESGAHNTRLRSALLAAGRSMLEDFQLVHDVLSAPYVPAAGTAYPDSQLGRHLLQTAQLLKSGIGTEIVNVNVGGWDTHVDQGTTEGRHAAALDDLARAVAAFREDMGPAMASTVLMVQTEFGRTPDKNASGGTDHGRAAAWMVLGPSVQGGIHLGPAGWPGLAPDALFEARYLRHAVDYRDIYAELLSRHLGSTLTPEVLLGYQAQPLELIG